MHFFVDYIVFSRVWFIPHCRPHSSEGQLHLEKTLQNFPSKFLSLFLLLIAASQCPKG